MPAFGADLTDDLGENCVRSVDFGAMAGSLLILFNPIQTDPERCDVGVHVCCLGDSQIEKAE